MSEIPATLSPTNVFHVAVLLYPGVTQLDFTGPLEVLQRDPRVHIDLVWKDLDRATTHWAHMQWLPCFGAVPVQERVVIDRNRITGAGVSSGIDFALRVVATIWGARRAQSAQLSMEYDPQPPFDVGSPAKAPDELVRSMRELLAPLAEKTGVAVRHAAARLHAR